MADSISVTGHVERLTRAPRVSLWGLSTLFMSVTRAVTAMIRGSGDGDHILDQEGVYGNVLLHRAVLRRRKESLRCGPIMLPISTETRIEALWKSPLSPCGKD